jgi:hypothetical protein
MCGWRWYECNSSSPTYISIIVLMVIRLVNIYIVVLDNNAWLNMFIVVGWLMLLATSERLWVVLLHNNVSLRVTNQEPL